MCWYRSWRMLIHQSLSIRARTGSIGCSNLSFWTGSLIGHACLTNSPPQSEFIATYLSGGLFSLQASGTSRRIRMGIARTTRAGCPSNPQSYTWGRRRRGWFDPISFRETGGYRYLAEDLAYFRRKTLCDFGAEVYRKTTGDLGLGKSSGKKQRLVARLAGERGELK